MFAVIKTGGLQYRVAEDDVIRVGRLKGEVGEIVQIGDVLLIGGGAPQLGTPLVPGASVAVEILEQSRGPKVIAFKKRRRKNSRRKRGHRQDYTVVRVSEILTDGKAPTKKARGRPAPKPRAEAATGEGKAETKPKAKSTAKTKAKTAARTKTVAKKPAAKGKARK